MQRSTVFLPCIKSLKKPASLYDNSKRLKRSMLSMLILPLICALPVSALAVTYDDPACYDAKYLEQFYKASKHVFAARIVEQPIKSPRTAIYQVIKVWKGDISKDTTFAYYASFPVRIGDSDTYRMPMGQKDEIDDIKLFMVNEKPQLLHGHFVPFTEAGCNSVRKITDLNPQADLNVKALENIKQKSEE